MGTIAPTNLRNNFSIGVGGGRNMEMEDGHFI